MFPDNLDHTIIPNFFLKKNFIKFIKYFVANANSILNLKKNTCRLKLNEPKSQFSIDSFDLRCKTLFKKNLEMR